MKFKPQQNKKKIHIGGKHHIVDKFFLEIDSSRYIGLFDSTCYETTGEKLITDGEFLLNEVVCSCIFLTPILCLILLFMSQLDARREFVLLSKIHINP